MTRKEAMRIAKKLNNQVQDGFIDENTARRAFKQIVIQYKKQQMYKDLQVNEQLWTSLSVIMR